YHGSCCDPTRKEERFQRQIKQIERLQRLEEEREAAYRENRRTEEAKAREDALRGQYYRLAEQHAEAVEDARLQHHGESEESRSERFKLFASLKQTIPSTARNPLIQVTAASPTPEANVQQLKFKNPVWGRSSYVQTLEQDVLTSFKEFSLAEKARLFEKRKRLFEWRKRIER